MTSDQPSAIYDADLLNALPTIAWTNNVAGEVTFYNKRWYDYTGLTFEETKDWGWKSVIHPDDLQYNLDTYAAILASEKEGSFEVRERGTDGKYRYHLVRTNPVRDAHGKIKFWVGTATDIQALKDLERQKDELLSIASHELKTPLTNIKAFNQLMCRKTNPELLRSFAEKSAISIQRLEKLVHDLLDVSRINAGKMTYTPAPFDFAKMLHETVENMQQIAPAHSLIIGHSDAVTYNGDQMRLEQVIQNLVSNAVKYSPGGGEVIIESHVVQHGLVLSVQDSGIGIAPEHVSRLFELYYRIDNTAMRYEGLGLGLFISAEIVKRHRGSMWIESKPDKGSTFYLRLPLHPDGAMQPMIDVEAYYSDSFITMGCNAGRLELTWHGFQDLKSIQQSCMRLLQMIQANKMIKLLADNTYVAGDWSEASEWVGNVFLPMLDEAGVRQIAWIASKSTFSQMAEQRTAALFEGNTGIRFFGSRAEGIGWLT